MNKVFSKFSVLLLAVAVGLVCSSDRAFGAATIVIENADAAGVGFNDATPAAPVGGNSGTTLGQQRLKAFEFAASIWAAQLPTGPTIVIRASWEGLSCTTTAGTLGSAGANNIFRNFPNAPSTGTWYPVALANTLAGTDLNGSTAEIRARFNINLGTSGCLQNLKWYYGLDTNHTSTQVNLVTVLLHEFAHGLGFQSFTDEENGVQPGTAPGFPSAFDKFLLDKTTNKTWNQMTDAERVASAINTGNLVWIGPVVTADAALLTGGKDGSNHPQMHAPNPVDPGSSVSHWATATSPNQLMEPFISNNLTHSVTTPQDLTFSLLRDIGWCPSCSSPPPPPPPANDSFAAAQTISGCSGTVNGTNLGATKETGEPSHSPDNNPGGASVWYQWTAPSTGNVTITTVGSSYDTLLGIYTGNSVGALTLITRNDDIVSGSNVQSSVTFNATAGTTYRIAVDGFDAETGSIVLNWSQSNCSATPTAQLSQTSYSVTEGSLFGAITVTRSGDTSGAASVKYATSDATNVNFQCNPNTVGQVTGQASRKCDYHIASGRLRFNAGETSKSIILSVVNDGYVEGPETFTLTLSSPVGMNLGANTSATVTITDDDVTPTNPIDGTRFYVRQLYVDLLSREPDQAGWDGWTNRIDLCGQPGQAPPPCDRVTVGGDGFLRSSEFFDRQFFVLRLYKTAFGRILQYSEVGDLAFVSGFLSSTDLELNKQELVSDIMSRSEFTTKYNGLGNAAFVDTLLQTAGVTVPQADRDAWVNALNSGTSRALVLRQISERPEVSAKHLVESQVVSAYYGFFTRNPDGAYTSYTTRLNSGEINLGDLANAFINAQEYRQRFGP